MLLAFSNFRQELPPLRYLPVMVGQGSSDSLRPFSSSEISQDLSTRPQDLFQLTPKSRIEFLDYNASVLSSSPRRPGFCKTRPAQGHLQPLLIRLGKRSSASTQHPKINVQHPTTWGVHELIHKMGQHHRGPYLRCLRGSAGRWARRCLRDWAR